MSANKSNAIGHASYPLIDDEGKIGNGTRKFLQGGMHAHAGWLEADAP